VLPLLVGSAASFLVALLMTPVLIRVLRARGIGQPIHDEVRHHSVKAGTPTMGGVDGRVRVPGGGQRMSPWVATERPHLAYVVSAGS